MGNSGNKEKCDPINVITTSGHRVGATGIMGRRHAMEDAHIVTNSNIATEYTILGIFDGHGGCGAAKFASQNFVSIFDTIPQFHDYLNQSDLTLNTNKISEALILAYEELDTKLRRKQFESKFTDSSGCTATVAIITPKYIICANAGDSRCILGSSTG